jgi:hypothetical protein
MALISMVLMSMVYCDIIIFVEIGVFIFSTFQSPYVN